MRTNKKQKVVFITGATSGIGEATAKLFVKNGHKVLVHGRNKKTIKSLCKQINESNLTIPIWGDLSDLKQVKSIAKQIDTTHLKINIAIFNAGIFQKGGLLSKDGFELDFAVNYLSQFILTHLILNKFAPNARIIFVSSSAYINGKIDLNNLGKQYLDNPMMAYATSKQLCLITALELAKHLDKKKICVNACNPGPTSTKLLLAGREYGWRNKGSSPLKAAHRIEWLALNPKLKFITGKYFNKYKTPNIPKRIREEKFTSAIYKKSMQLYKTKRIK